MKQTREIVVVEFSRVQPNGIPIVYQRPIVRDVAERNIRKGLGNWAGAKIVGGMSLQPEEVVTKEVPTIIEGKKIVSDKPAKAKKEKVEPEAE